MSSLFFSVGFDDRADKFGFGDLASVEIFTYLDSTDELVDVLFGGLELTVFVSQ